MASEYFNYFVKKNFAKKKIMKKELKRGREQFRILAKRIKEFGENEKILTKGEFRCNKGELSTLLQFFIFTEMAAAFNEDKKNKRVTVRGRGPRKQRNFFLLSVLPL